MSKKVLIYTSNPPFSPENINKVEEWAKSMPKMRLTEAIDGVGRGDLILTSRGNKVYVLGVLDSDNEQIYQYTRNYGLKAVKITGINQIVPYNTWCKDAISVNKVQTKLNKKMTNNSIKNLSTRLKEMFMPTEATDVRIATDGNICVATADGYVAIDSKNALISYPEELTIKLPVYIMSKPKDQLAVGDVVVRNRSYAKVTKIDGDKITAIGYTGAGCIIHPIKDFLFNQTMVRVVVSLAGNIGGQMNPMMMMLLADKGEDSILPFLLMNQQGGQMNMNPMMMMLLAGKDNDSSLKDLLLFSAMSGQNLFAAPQQVNKAE